jgi:DNA-binding ferritin-like protein
MKELLIRLRANQMFYHSAHILCGKSTFFSDHEFFKETYESVEKDYDDVAERMVGLGMYDELQLGSLVNDLHFKLKDAPSTEVEDNKLFFQYALKIELGLTQIIEKLAREGKLSQGTLQLVGDIANRSEKRRYMIQRRLQ